MNVAKIKLIVFYIQIIFINGNKSRDCNCNANNDL